MGSEPVARSCACGCGEEVAEAKYPSWQKRYIHGHNARGQASHRYNGGLCFDKHSGRWQIMCRDGTHMWYYRGVMAAQIGRLLRPDELVHHVNEDPTDDRPENLEMTNRADHLAIHREAVMAGRRASAAARSTLRA